MDNKKFAKKILGFTLVLLISFLYFGCDDTFNNSLVNVMVINETGRTITDVRFTASDGSIHMIDEITQTRSNHGQGHHGMGNRGRGHCWINQDETYTLSWHCEERGWIYAQTGGHCGRREEANHFSFRCNRQRTIILREDDTWELIE
jgi:hypothetical protein